jgi:transketolase
MTSNQEQYLKILAYRVRRHIIKMATKGGCFIGASLSCVDILTYLYCSWLNLSRENLNDPNRDYLLLSKGHDVPALYGLFAELGLIDPARLENHLKTNDDIYWHPNRNIPGVEFYSGSLGHLLSVGVGIAMDIKLRGGSNRVVVILGDGELNEGSVWEAALVAAAKDLDNLIAIIDRNAFQANIATEDLIPLEPIADKFNAFGWYASRLDGHDYQALEAGLTALPLVSGKPSVIIADTVRGKGLPSISARADRWFCNFSATEVEMLLEELDGASNAELKSETIVAR